MWPVTVMCAACAARMMPSTVGPVEQRVELDLLEARGGVARDRVLPLGGVRGGDVAERRRAGAVDQAREQQPRADRLAVLPRVAQGGRPFRIRRPCRARSSRPTRGTPVPIPRGRRARACPTGPAGRSCRARRRAARRAGTAIEAEAPAAWIRPSRTRTVAFSIGGAPVPSISRAPTSAKAAAGMAERRAAFERRLREPLRGRVPR